jgi:hypothetical protein
MAGAGVTPRETGSGWENPWLWAGLLLPLLCIGPWVALAFLIAELVGGFLGIVMLLVFLMIPLGGLVSAIGSIWVALAGSESTSVRVALAVLGLASTGIGMVIGFDVGADAIRTACGDGNDCF